MNVENMPKDGRKSYAKGIFELWPTRWKECWKTNEMLDWPKVVK
jgi:hypothetical protein